MWKLLLFIYLLIDNYLSKYIVEIYNRKYIKLYI